MKNQLEGKVGLVTGAGSGIGRACALALAREKANVVVSDVVTAGGEETVGLIKKTGGEAIFVKADVSKQNEVEELINKTIEKYARIDCAVNNAGVSSGKSGWVATADLGVDEWDFVLNLNLRGTWLCMKYEIPHMLKQGSGSIVNTASATALIGFAGAAHYCASKTRYWWTHKSRRAGLRKEWYPYKCGVSRDHGNPHD